MSHRDREPDVTPGAEELGGVTDFGLVSEDS